MSPATTRSRPRQTARIVQAVAMPAHESTALAPTQTRVQAFDPFLTSLKSSITDPVWQAIQFKWSDKQQHGRLVYDAMMKHAAVAAPFHTLVSILKSYKPVYRPRSRDPSARQQMYADFLNYQVSRLGMTGDPRQGWEKMMEWFAQGWKYGFSLSEMETVLAAWQGNARIQINRVVTMPQASLDLGFQPLEEFGETILTSNIADKRYRCFQVGRDGTMEAVIQYWRGTSNLIPAGEGVPGEVRWTGNDLNRILHHVHRGGEGNPYGESLLYVAFYHWASLYTCELLEEAMLDAGLPLIGIGYKTPDGVPRPALHEEIVNTIRKQDPTTGVLVVPDGTFTSVARSNPDWVAHITAKKKELRAYITQSLLMPRSVYTETEDSQSDARNIIMVFFKRILPALLAEVSNVMTWQFGKRLIDANWVKLNDEDYPELCFPQMTEDDLKASMTLLAQATPFIASDRYGEFLENFIPTFDRTWIPKDHANSVAKKREIPSTNGQMPAGSPGGGGNTSKGSENSSTQQAV